MSELLQVVVYILITQKNTYNNYGIVRIHVNIHVDSYAFNHVLCVLYIDIFILFII